MFIKLYSYLNIPYVQRDQENRYYGYLFNGNLTRGMFFLAISTLISSLLLTYFTLLYKKTHLFYHITSAGFCLILMFVMFIYFHVLRYYKDHLKLQTKKAFMSVVLFFNCIFLLLAITISLLQDNPFIFYSFITLVATLISLTPALILIQYVMVSIIYTLILNIGFSFDTKSYLSALLVIFVSFIISYAMYINKLNEFQLFYRIKEKNLVLQEYNKELSEFSYSDALTGVNNRRRIEDILRECWKSCKANYQNLSIIFIDIDNFKAYNDTYGHVEGDFCLVEVASTIEDACAKLPKNKNCSMGRYGGEEFIIILPKCDKAQVLSFGKKVVEKIESLHIPHGKNLHSPWVTISCGATTIVPDEQKRILHILETADQALYYVKRNGKNSIVHYTDLSDINEDESIIASEKQL